MKQFCIHALVFVIFASCSTRQSESNEADSSSTKSVATSENQITTDPLKDLAIGSDKCTATQFGDSTLFSYSNYKIATASDSGILGERIWIFNNNTWHQLQCEEPYFKGLINNYIILDFGTSTVRGLEVRDIGNDSLVFSESYYDDLQIEHTKIHFWAQVEPDAAHRPHCEVDSSSGLSAGYVEDQYFDTKTLTASRTGTIKCYMFE